MMVTRQRSGLVGLDNGRESVFFDILPRGGLPVRLRVRDEGMVSMLELEQEGVPAVLAAGSRREMERLRRTAVRAAAPRRAASFPVAAAAVVALAAAFALGAVAGGADGHLFLSRMVAETTAGQPPRASAPEIPAVGAAVASTPVERTASASLPDGLPAILRQALSGPAEARELGELVAEIEARDPILGQGLMRVMRAIAAFVSAGRPVPEELLEALPRNVLARMVQEISQTGRPMPSVAPRGSVPRDRLGLDGRPAAPVAGASGPPVVTSLDPSEEAGAAPTDPARGPVVPGPPVTAPPPPRAGLTWGQAGAPGAVRDAHGIPDMPEPGSAAARSGGRIVLPGLGGGTVERPEDLLSFGLSPD